MKALDLSDSDLFHWEVALHWRRPTEVVGDDPSDVLPDAAFETHGIYRFIRTHHLQTYEGGDTIRIGIAYDQTVGKRLSQYKKDVPQMRQKGVLYVSYAELEIDANHKRARYEGVEHLLCFVVKPPWNERKINTVPNDWYHITNSGSRGDLPSELTYPALLYRP